MIGHLEENLERADVLLQNAKRANIKNRIFARARSLDKTRLVLVAAPREVGRDLAALVPNAAHNRLNIR